MLTSDAPEWFDWFYDLGQALVSLEDQHSDGKALRLFLSVPTSEYSLFALALGGMNAAHTPRIFPESGDMVASWSDHKCGEYFFRIASETHAYIGGSKVKYPGWPVAYVPEGTPENRTPRRIPKEERDELLKVSGVHPNAWYTWYANLCIFPISIIGHKTEVILQRDELQDLKPVWLNEKGKKLLHTYSKQITNPNRFQFFPFSIFSAEITHNRKWLRQMESRLVICESFSAYEQMHPQYQQLAPRVVLMDRRKDASVRGHNLIKELQNMHAPAKSPKIENVLRKAPAGIYTYLYLETMQEDVGNSELADLEIFEL
jgi:hypothetical protein